MINMQNQNAQHINNVLPQIKKSTKQSSESLDNFDFSPLLESTSNIFHNEANSSKRNNMNEYKLNYNPLKHAEDPFDDFDKLNLLKRMAQHSELPQYNSARSYDFESTVPESPKSAAKKNYKFLSSLRHKNKNKTKGRNPMIIQNPIHFFKINVPDDNEVVGKKGGKHTLLNFIDDDKFYIDQESYSRNQIHLIAAKILNKCNVSQVKHKNNNNSLKHGNGKLMITGGKSIEEFERQYSL